MPDTPARPTLPQRVVLWILGALLFYIVALYPNVLMARFQPDDAVHYGFLKWLAVVFVLYWVAAQLFFTERPADTRAGRQTLAVTAAILLLVGIFSPIVSFSFVGDVDFFRSGYGDGYILLLMTAASLALAVTGRWKQVIVPALGSLAVILWTFLGVQETISDARSGGSPELAGNPHAGLAPATMASIQWEWGWILLFAGSGLLVYAAARRDEMADAAPPFVAVEDEDESEAVPAETATDAAPGAPLEPTLAEPAAEGPAEAPAAEPAEGDGEPATASGENEAAAAESADATARATEEEPATSAAEPAAEAEREQPEEATAESARAEESATTAAAADETPATEPATAADETAPAEAADPATAEAQAPATEPEAAEAPAPEADDAAADADAQAESAATPAASATGEAESSVAEPAPAEAEANDAAGEPEPASGSAASDTQESEGASSASGQASAEASQPAPGKTAAGSESGKSDASDSKAASDTKNE